MTQEFYRPTLNDLKAEAPLTTAEQRLLDCCKTGATPVFGASRPDKTTVDNTIRAELIRYLLLGGCEGGRPNPKGVRLCGAFVTGTLDFEGCISSLLLAAVECTFESQPNLMDAELGQLILGGSQMPGLNAHRIRLEGSCLLRNKFHSKGTVDLAGARLRGQLDCGNGQFDGEGDHALICDGIKVGTDVFLRGGFTALGEVSFSGAQIVGQLDCTDGRFDGGDGKALNCEAMTVREEVFLRDGFSAIGEVSLTRTRIDGNLRISDAILDGDMIAERLSVGGTFTWRDVTGTVQEMDMEDAQLGKLDDNRASWSVAGFYFLGGLQYDAVGPAMSQRDRLLWLEKNKTVADEDAHGNALPSFDPQPYSQLAGVLQNSGHVSGAAAILHRREQKLATNRHARDIYRSKGTASAMWRRPTADLRRLLGLIFDWLFGHGYRPMRALYWSIGFWLTATMFYGTVYDRAQMAPAAPVIMASQDWRDAVASGCPITSDPDHGAEVAAGCAMPLAIWEGRATGKPADSAADYESFNRWLYGADIFIPLVGLGQEVAWAPSRDRGNWGWWGFHTRWIFQVMGWVITALGAAVLTGLVGRRD